MFSSVLCSNNPIDKQYRLQSSITGTIQFPFSSSVPLEPPHFYTHKGVFKEGAKCHGPTHQNQKR